MINKKKFAPVSPKAMDSFKTFAPEIIKKTVEISMKRHNEISQHKDQAHSIINSGMEFTTKMLESALLTGEISLLEDELKWAADRLPHDGVSMKHVLVRLKIYRKQIINILPEDDASEIVPFLDWMIQWQENHLKEEFHER